MFTKFGKIIIVGFMIVGLVYLGACVYANIFQHGTGETTLPTVDKAQYEVRVLNTRNIIYTNKYKADGSKYILQGYYELIGNKYKYQDEKIILDEKIFGEIIVRRR